VRRVLDAQLAAVDGFGGRFDLRLLIPYLTRLEELRHWRDHVRHSLNRAVPVGAMVETPAALLDIGNWLAVADFVAIGCNDLMQCLFAADRDRPELRDYLDPCAPPLYRFLKQAADNAGDALGRVQLCGVLPQLPGVLPVLLGLGFRAFSVDAPLVPFLARAVRSTSLDAARARAAQVCEAADSRRVADLLGWPLASNSGPGADS
jgi:phosphoenolpyruvate-protein kinase (PTS system EI component)